MTLSLATALGYFEAADRSDSAGAASTSSWDATRDGTTSCGSSSSPSTQTFQGTFLDAPPWRPVASSTPLDDLRAGWRGAAGGPPAGERGPLPRSVAAGRAANLRSFVR